MNKHLQTILDLLQQSKSLTADEKKCLADAIIESDKEIAITEFKLERTEKVKRTTAILLEETIAELEQKRKSVEVQNRELEIEAALERVRSRSMAMHQSSELGDLSFELVKQVQALGIATWHCAFNIYDEDQESSTEWGSNAKGSYPIYKTPREGIFKRYYEIGQRGETLHVEVIGEDKCADHYAYLCTLPGVGETLVKVRDSGTPFPKSQIDHVAYFKYGYLLFITFEPAPGAHDIFKRFAKVFEQTYTRFLDLQKAEAQARESKIEAALERVRSRTMAMHSSDELADVVGVMFKQLETLEFGLFQILVTIIDTKKNIIDWWSKGPKDVDVAQRMTIPIIDHPFLNGWIQEWKKGIGYAVYNLKGEMKRSWDEYLFTQTDLTHLPQEVKDLMRSVESAWLSDAFLKYGSLQAAGTSPLSDEQAQVLRRFANALDHAYTRIIDLQKAEAQAREAQIEAALEKVRSRTLAMHTAHELGEVVLVITEKLNELGIVIDVTGVILCTYFQNSKDVLHWMVSPDFSFAGSYLVPYFDHPIFNDTWESKISGADYFTKSFSVEEKKTFFEYAFEHSDYKNFPDEFKQWVFQHEKLSLSFAWQKNSAVLISSHTGLVPGESHKEILKRFSKVFEQAYIRFLDLQKAEAQAKEAKIEAGLERVRSRAMAMQTSEELNALIGTVFTELTKLDLVLTRCVIMTYDNKTNDARWWMANSEAPEQPMNFHVKYHEHPPNLAYFSAWRQRTVKWIYPLEGVIKKQWDEFIFSQTELSLLPDFVIAGMKAPDRVYLNASFYNSGNLTLASLEPLSDEHFDILIRFAKVFDLTYTRFNDLKQAEAQAREAKIEAALERVRSRTMAMQRSDELVDVASILFQQVKALGVPQWNCGFNIWEIGDMEFTYYPGSPDGNIFPSPCKIPLTEHPVFISFDESRKRCDELFIYEKEGEYQAGHYRYMLSLPGVGDLLQSMLDAGFQLPTYQIDHIVNFSHGNLIFITYEHFPEMHDVFKRFGKVFEQTYTRFLDLKKAEAQAREAQIEASLERIRTHSILMQRSDELKNISRVFHDQLLLLNIPSEFSYVWLPDEKKQEHQFWATWAEEENGISLSRSKSVTYPLDKNEPYTATCLAAWKNKEELLEVPIPPGDVDRFFETWAELLGGTGKLKPEFFPEGLFYSEAYMKYGCFGMNVRRMLTEDEKQILLRFSIEFERAYTRFLDLQKAEEQARESQIEASLERVRSKTMAMHNSRDVGDTVATLFDELKKLAVKTNRCGIIIFSNTNDSEVWTARSTPNGEVNLIIGHLDVALHPMLTSARNTWKNKEASFSYEMVGDDLINYYRSISNQSGYIIQVNMDALPSKEIHTEFYFPEGAVFAFTSEPIPVDDAQIFKRLASVFGQTYRRYLDLQKAEAQAREAHIEASLERVRSKAMAMHKSEDLTAAVAVVFDELEKLDLGMSRCGIGILNKEKRSADVWTTSKSEGQNTVDVSGDESMDIHPLLQKAFDAWLRQEDLNYVLQGEDLADYYRALQHTNFRLPESEVMVKNAEMLHHHYYMASFQDGGLYAFRENPFTDEAKNVMKRFANVFSLTYKRFQDILKAEAQAREAQIEAALEKVRSRSLIMKESSEIKEVITVVLEKIHQLGIAIENRSAIILEFQSGYRVVTQWVASPLHPQAIGLVTPYFENPILADFWEAREKGVEFYENPYSKEVKDSLFRYFLDRLEMQTSEESQKFIFESQSYSLAVAYESNSAIAIATHTGKLLRQDEIEVLRRFARVFEQSYTRFLDLKKAEEQAREATIESSLEKVRGKAMGMHNSNDLTSTASLVFTELRKLGLDSFRSGVGLLTKENRKVKLFSATSSDEGGSLSLVGWAVLDHHPILSKTYDSWINNEDYFPVLEGESLKTYYEQVVSTFTVPVEHSEGYEQYGYFLPFSEGLFYGWSERPYTEADVKILNRFRAIVDLTFRRYMELQKSEENAIEAIRQASLDRVRAEIASMRTTTDLDRITPLIWKELNTLNIPFVRCGVFIMDKPQHKIHTFLSTPEGKAIAAFNLPYETSGNVGEILTHWLNKQIYISHWDESAFSELGEQLAQQGAIPSKEVYMSTVPTGGIHLHCLPFLQGMLYVGNTTQLQESDIHLIQSVADAFSTAYARYEDFNKLESAKAQIEKTLTDLKLTQNQLVQSEKMASLGELTAGIAHEIQNPLNFVNNFSEVSNELLAEMKEEIQKGNYNEVETITNSIKQNLEKILHHGKRADGIVKGMLQHSRSSSGVKEPTDINALADEYLRLAYHGFRAKDKSFNASTQTDLDKSIGKINVVPQDIGRVVLNLITNAFYAVTEKQKIAFAEYQPTVTLSTKRGEGCLLISVIDNGNGIPEHIREKIFQPFFTTKPTGQGTGLGLSLSYDIVKAHGGELKIETKEGEGSEFVIHLPVS